MAKNKELNQLLQVALNSVAYVGSANYQERQDEAIASFNKAFNDCFYTQEEPIKEKMHPFYKAVIQAIEHVGQANYDHREKEAVKKVNDAFDAI